MSDVESESLGLQSVGLTIRMMTGTSSEELELLESVESSDEFEDEGAGSGAEAQRVSQAGL